jgi:hypothetical protein
MRRMAMRLVPVMILVLVLPCYLAAGANDNVKFALHLAPHGTYTCKSQPVINSFGDLVREIDTIPQDGLDVFLVVFDYDSLTVVEYGLTWPSDWGTASTHVCIANSLVVGSIVNPGDGMAFAWIGATCKIPSDRPGGNTPPFFVTSYSWMLPTGPGEIRMKDDPPTQEIGVVECRSEELRGYEYVTHVYDAAVQVAPHDGPYPGPCFETPTFLDFGSVQVGSFADRTFTITNTGSGTLAGTMRNFGPAAYSLVGDPALNLAPGQSKQFTVRFAPQGVGTSNGAFDCSLGGCVSITCTGEGVPPVATETSTWGAIKAIFK